MGNEVAIVGVGIHKFGRFGDKPFEEIGAESIRMALKDANMDWKDIQVGYASTASSSLPHNAGPRTTSQLGRTGIGVSDVQAACASGGVAIKNGVHAIQSGRFDTCLVFGIEKAPRGFFDPSLSFLKWQIETGLSTNPAYWAMSCVRHMHDYGTTEMHLAKVAYKNHKYSVYNPYAMYQKEFGLEEILNSRVVCWPVRLFEICAPNEGAAALILVPLEKAHKYTSKPITIAASAHALAMYSADLRAPVIQMSGRVNNENPTVVASKKAYEEAGLGPEDINAAEVQDTDAFMEITHYEELGFCPVGEAGRFIDERQNEIGGKTPVNLSGGLISKGEPTGASHLGQVVDLCWQLRGELGPRTVKGAKVTMAQVTGAMGHTAVTILKK
ncbi:thiolase family protein [Chloroflexota bacterium]